MPDPLLIGGVIASAVSFLVSLFGQPGALRAVAAPAAGWLAAWLFTGDPWAGFFFAGWLGAMASSRLG